MVKFINGSKVKLHGSCFFDSTGSNLVAKYWYAAEDTNWFNPNNWFSDSGHSNSTTVPDSSSNVYIVGTQRPIANLDGSDAWVNPHTINVGTIGIGLSGTSKTVQTNFRGTGTVSVSGSITIVDPTP